VSNEVITIVDKGKDNLFDAFIINEKLFLKFIQDQNFLALECLWLSNELILLERRNDYDKLFRIELSKLRHYVSERSDYR
jgi:hypothetical protein